MKQILLRDIRMVEPFPSDRRPVFSPAAKASLTEVAHVS